MSFVPVDLQTLGSVISYSKDGQSVTSSWTGKAVWVWAKFSEIAPLGNMRQHLVEAYEFLPHSRPKGCITAVCIRQES